MTFEKPLRATLVGQSEIWIVDATGAFVTRFPRVSDNLQADLARAGAVAAADPLDDDDD